MKRFLSVSAAILFSVMTTPAPVIVVGGPLPVVIGGGTPATYLVKQDFEGTGYDNSETWTESGAGTVDEDYTGVVIEGSQSLRVNLSGNQGATVSPTFAAQSTVYGFFKWQRQSNTGVADIASFKSGASRRLTVRVEGTGTLTIVHGTPTATTTDAVSTGTTVYIWFKYVAGSGSNGQAEIGWSTDGTRPTSGTKYASITTGTSTTTVTTLELGTSAANETMDLQYDHVRVDDVQIGDNPS